ncbi:hypothetical protein K490DRAFT_60877 [Saccharata proteae CBS 121410]|uniref:Uncharacterized protein n=1 Tax=Saccharata proteae CBS 121410 TaxID=1314787 RepID=A0A9P4LYB8_9PEZI|nr:hypothetical protein K490DRAFT_60877 [Saccharata proteae CBS 121410]
MKRGGTGPQGGRGGWGDVYNVTVNHYYGGRARANTYTGPLAQRDPHQAQSYQAPPASEPQNHHSHRRHQSSNVLQVHQPSGGVTYYYPPGPGLAPRGVEPQESSHEPHHSAHVVPLHLPSGEVKYVYPPRPGHARHESEPQARTHRRHDSYNIIPQTLPSGAIEYLYQPLPGASLHRPSEQGAGRGIWNPEAQVYTPTSMQRGPGNGTKSPEDFPTLPSRNSNLQERRLRPFPVAPPPRQARNATKGDAEVTFTERPSLHKHRRYQASVHSEGSPSPSEGKPEAGGTAQRANKPVPPTSPGRNEFNWRDDTNQHSLVETMMNNLYSGETFHEDEPVIPRDIGWNFPVPDKYMDTFVRRGKVPRNEIEGSMDDDIIDDFNSLALATSVARAEKPIPVEQQRDEIAYLQNPVEEYSKEPHIFIPATSLPLDIMPTDDIAENLQYFLGSTAVKKITPVPDRGWVVLWVKGFKGKIIRQAGKTLVITREHCYAIEMLVYEPDESNEETE